MAIKILPARLANQIAAGEVVERPASVVKELVENCIDSGATQIDIEIDKGGSKRILVRDNGSGIAKEELELALSRHATSKIHSLDDLEAIISLGFRGEALASISSVSRLTLTSRPAEQSEAWAAYAEGRDMTVTIKPAAHPTGTSVEVVDLFFNTPARRKFLRTDKTEFGHIDELIKRIALSRFDIGITLSHNGTLIRQYRKVTTEAMRLRRLEAICGRQFVKHAVAVEVEHCGLGLKGWVCHPHGARAQSDVQHCFVNQRMMKDKLINHAIRQGYANALRADQFAAYVLFIDIDADQVDVNVHPAKHEVRFHQARWVHDFIYQSVADVLRQCLDSSGQTFLPTEPDVLAPVSKVSNASLAPSVSSVDVASYGGTTQSLDSTWQRASRGRASPSAKAQLNYGNLLTPTPERQLGEISRQYDSAEIEVIRSESLNTQFLGQPLSIVGSTYLLMQQKTELVLMDLNYAAYLLLVGQFQCGEKRTSLQAYPLLIPVVLNLTTSEIKIALEVQSQLAQFGIQFKKKSDTQLMLLTVCAPMKQVNLQQIFPRLLAQSATLFKSHTPASAALGQVLARLIFQPQSSFMLTKAITLIADLENCWQGKLSAHFSRLLRPVDLSGVIEAFSYE